MLTRAAAAADRPRRGRLPLHRGRPPAARRHLVVVGEHPRPLASEAERGARRAGAAARARHLRRLHASRRPSSSPSGCVGVLPRRSDARVLFRQRIDGRRSRAEAGAVSTGATAASRRGGRSSRCTTPTTATPSARCRRARTRSSRGRSRRCCFRSIARARAVLLSLPARARARDVPRSSAWAILGAAARRSTADTVAARARRADAAGRRRDDRLAGGVPGGRPPALRPARHADDRRRSAHRLRPHRPDVRVRARRRHARHHLPVEGAHRRLPAARRHGRRPSRSTTRSSATTARKTFFHGHSFTANPLACAVALASLDLFHETDALERVRQLEALAARRPRRRLRRCRSSATCGSSAASASSSWSPTRRRRRAAAISTTSARA